MCMPLSAISGGSDFHITINSQIRNGKANKVVPNMHSVRMKPCSTVLF